MTRTTNMRLRGLWFQIHKWIGLTLAILIVPISVTGSALVWHDWLDEALNPGRYAVTSSEAALAPSAYAAAAQRALAPGEQILSIRYPEHGHGPMMVSAGRPQAGGTRPIRTSVWLDPADGRVLDKAGGNDGAVRFLHVLHGRLQIQSFGRELVGWVGVAMSISCMTGIWL